MGPTALGGPGEAVIASATGGFRPRKRWTYHARPPGQKQDEICKHFELKRP